MRKTFRLETGFKANFQGCFKDLSLRTRKAEGTMPTTTINKTSENVVAFKEDVKAVEEKVDALTELVREQTTIIKRLIQGYRT